MNKIDNLDSKKRKKIGVVGLGYVGLNLALFMCERDRTVRGVDIDDVLVENINKGVSPISEHELPDILQDHITKENLKASTDFSVLGDCEVVFVTVGTPLKEDYSPSLQAIREASHSIGKHLQKEQLVIYRSTLVPGTTEEVIQPILEKESGLYAGKDFYLAFCPERLAEGGSMEDFTGSALADIQNLPIIVGGTEQASRKTVSEFWQSLGLDTIEVSTPRDAELAKLADNLWIDLNIALANEIALLSEKIGADALEVIKAANTLPKGQHKVNILYPGPGVGGYCLPKDPWFLHHLGREHDLELKTPKISRKINDAMPKHMYERIKRIVDEKETTKVTILGLAFKNSTSDLRNTPSKDLIDLLKSDQIELSLYDPWVNKREAEDLFGMEVADSLEEAVQRVDCIVVMVGHPEFHTLPLAKIKELSSETCEILDGRGVLDAEKVVEAGFPYHRIGLGREVKPNA